MKSISEPLGNTRSLTDLLTINGELESEIIKIINSSLSLEYKKNLVLRYIKMQNSIIYSIKKISSSIGQDMINNRIKKIVKCIVADNHLNYYTDFDGLSGLLTDPLSTYSDDTMCYYYEFRSKPSQIAPKANDSRLQYYPYHIYGNEIEESKKLPIAKEESKKLPIAKEKPKNRVININEKCVPWFTSKMTFNVNEDKNKFIVGHHYMLKNNEFSVDAVLELKHIVNNEDLDDILIMKQIGGAEMRIYSITPQDCSYLNIPFENGLMVFSKDSNNFSDLNNVNKEFDPNDLSTYPKDYDDLTIHEMWVACDSFFDKGNSKYMFVDGTEFSNKDFPSVLLTLKENVESVDGSLPLFKGFKYLTIPVFRFDEKTKKTLLTFMIKFSEPNHIGINPNALEGKKLDDLFKIDLLLIGKDIIDLVKKENLSFSDIIREAYSPSHTQKMIRSLTSII